MFEDICVDEIGVGTALKLWTVPRAERKLRWVSLLREECDVLGLLGLLLDGHSISKRDFQIKSPPFSV
jgi:hypothetical protein